MSDDEYLRLKPRSTDVTEGAQRAPARAMLRAVGMRDDDFRKPLVAVASSWNEVTPCNLHLDKLADRAKAGVREAGGYPLEFTTIAVSDGISMGTEGMRASLISGAPVRLLELGGLLNRGEPLSCPSLPHPGIRPPDRWEVRREDRVRHGEPCGPLPRFGRRRRWAY